MKNIEKLLSEIEFYYHKSADQKTNIFTPYHTKFDCELERGEKAYKATYQCNVAYSNMDNIKTDFIRCAILDADSYEDSKDLIDFCQEFGYDYQENKKECTEIYNLCKKAFIKMNDMFSKEELNMLREYLRD